MLLKISLTHFINNLTARHTHPEIVNSLFGITVCTCTYEHSYLFRSECYHFLALVNLYVYLGSSHLI